MLRPGFCRVNLNYFISQGAPLLRNAHWLSVHHSLLEKLSLVDCSAVWSDGERVWLHGSRRVVFPSHVPTACEGSRGRDGPSMTLSCDFTLLPCAEECDYVVAAVNFVAEHGTVCLTLFEITFLSTQTLLLCCWEPHCGLVTGRPCSVSALLVRVAHNNLDRSPHFCIACWPAAGWKLLPQYGFFVDSGEWKHRTR